MKNFEKLSYLLVIITVLLLGTIGFMLIVGVVIKILGLLFNYPWESIIAISSIYWIGAMIYNSNNDEFID